MKLKLFHVVVEIERKFLVKSDLYKQEALSKKKIIQGFLNSHPERTVRVRIKQDKGYITVKGLTTKDGTTRFEWEREISVSEANDLLLLCEPGVVEKFRYEVRVKNHLFEIDEFLEDNHGLVIAEIELNYPTQIFSKPQWLGAEVTGEIKYYNSHLSKNPFKNW